MQSNEVGSAVPPPSRAEACSAGAESKPEVKEKTAETARVAGRGGLAIAAAKLSFITFGFIQQLILPRLLGVDGYGQVSRVLSVVSIVNNVVVAMAIQGVSRSVSTAPEAEADRAFRRSLVVHIWVAMALSLGLALSAGPITAFMHAPHLTTHLRLVAIVVLLYGIYAPLVGSLNGKRRFIEQAGLDIGYAVIRLCSMVGGAAFFIRAGESGALGAVAGFIAAAALIVPIAWSRSGVGAPFGSAPSLRDYGAFLVPLFLGQSCLNLLMQTDMVLLSRFAGQAAGASELGVKVADSLTGVYRGAQLFAFLPYQLLMSITFILFPMLARASAEGDKEAVRSYTRTGVRLALLLTGLLCGAVSGVAPHVLRLVFPEEIWKNGGDALRILSLGMGAFTILGVISAALTSMGRAVASWLLTATGVILIAAGCFILMPRARLGPEMLVQAATAVAIGLTVTAAAGGVVLARVAGGFVGPLSLVRVLVALGVAVFAGSRLPWLGKPVVVVEVVLVAGIYVAVLIALRELGAHDLGRIKQVLGRRS
jgi:stage V sporulation protein B